MKNFNGKLIFNLIKNSFHTVESTESVEDITVVFTEDSKCFPINEIEIIPIYVAEKCLRNLSKSNIASLLIDKEGKQVKLNCNF
jgi:hypothetical protein